VKKKKKGEKIMCNTAELGRNKGRRGKRGGKNTTQEFDGRKQ